MSASGASPVNDGASGGSGGSILIFTEQWKGNGTIASNGGSIVSRSSTGSGGSGGRVAIYFSNKTSFGGAVTAFGGRGARSGGPGTILASTRGYQGLFISNANNSISTNEIDTVANTRGSIAWLDNETRRHRFFEVRLTRKAGLALIPSISNTFP